MILSAVKVQADEGMWLPQLLKQLNEADMRLRGLQISAADIYSADSISLKDAIVLFGGGCTGEVISGSGLVLTNHHCGFSQIQEHSTLEKNYLRDGFWAKELSDEIPCPGLSVTFIVKIEDVTSRIMPLLSDTMTESQRNDVIKNASAEIEKTAVKGTGYEARVRQFYSGNEFYLITTETFDDIRMVGAPPSSIGKFGGDTDNWMWPRHTGDFSIFRIYADRNNKPAEYNAENIPFTPRKFFPISLKGVKEKDFTMVYGFPGRTQEYISSFATETIIGVNNPNRIKARDERLRIIDEAMRKSEELHLKYADKQSSISNGWKKMRGETKGLREANVIELKRRYEKDFRRWSTSDPQRNIRYGEVLPKLEELYTTNRAYIHANDFYAEAAFAPEIISWAGKMRKMDDALQSGDTASVRKQKEQLLVGYAAFYKDYDIATDKALTASMIRLFNENVADSLKPVAFTEMRQRYNGDFNRWTEDLFKKSMFDDSAEVRRFLLLPDAAKKSKLTEDAAFLTADALYDYYTANIAPKITSFSQEVNRLNRLYMAGQREFEPQRAFYPDANSTLRVTYGVVKGYEPRDGIYYEYQTYLDGIAEKYVDGSEEFDVPDKLLQLHQSKDYGRYGVNGKLPVAFIATNHTTGGNSGSPVINARGELIGTNYDRVWEGTMSDILYNPEICRNITLDIRYTLFIIDRFANAQRLIREMKIIE
jgi:hypothetical protein